LANLFLGGVVATAFVVILGVSIALPPFFQPAHGTNALLAFNIVSADNMPHWCIELSQLLEKNNVRATVFFPGRLAEDYPECLKSFDMTVVDIGSSTYNYTDLSSQMDYTRLLEEVRKGKEAIDNVGGIDSKSFKAPYGRTDENIYSLLSSSGILADFSYQDRYHKYYQGQFIRFDANVYDTTTRSDFKSFLDTHANAEKPIQINIDNTISLSEISSIIDSLHDKRVTFVNGSTLTGLELTLRRES
jgi:peptidoglycan/xylan/chitin deacetylase (PgdA/CDA1 family)